MGVAVVTRVGGLAPATQVFRGRQCPPGLLALRPQARTTLGSCCWLCSFGPISKLPTVSFLIFKSWGIPATL